MSKNHWCDKCREISGSPIYCAPKRCYCGHDECPAYDSYIPLENVPRPVMREQSQQKESWAGRAKNTWLDKM